MADYICVKYLHDRCNCLKCREVKDHKDALAYYRSEVKDAAHCKEFPEKENKKG